MDMSLEFEDERIAKAIKLYEAIEEITKNGHGSHAQVKWSPAENDFVVYDVKMKRKNISEKNSVTTS